MAGEALGPLGSPVSWAGKPYREIRDVAEREGSVAVVPVGSVEQHGHHLPVATDAILATAVGTEGAERAATDRERAATDEGRAPAEEQVTRDPEHATADERVSADDAEHATAADAVPVLVTPPVWTGYSPHHLPFGGTVSVEHGTLLTLLEDVADSVLTDDFDAILFLNGHGGNAALVESATSTVGVAHPDVEVLGLTYFDLASPFVDDIRESDPGGMAHGGEFETSLMAHLHPDLVRDDREGSMTDEPYDEATVDLFAAGPLAVYRPFDAYSDSGAIGAPELATAEAGAELFDRLADAVADLLREIHRRNAGGAGGDSHDAGGDPHGESEEPDDQGTGDADDA